MLLMNFGRRLVGRGGRAASSGAARRVSSTVPASSGSRTRRALPGSHISQLPPLIPGNTPISPASGPNLAGARRKTPRSPRSPQPAPSLRNIPAPGTSRSAPGVAGSKTANAARSRLGVQRRHYVNNGGGNRLVAAPPSRSRRFTPKQIALGAVGGAVGLGVIASANRSGDPTAESTGGIYSNRPPIM